MAACGVLVRAGFYGERRVLTSSGSSISVGSFRGGALGWRAREGMWRARVSERYSCPSWGKVVSLRKDVCLL